MQGNTKKVMGLRVQGCQFFPQQVQIDQSFEKCPIAHAVGIPLYVKRLFDKPRKQSGFYIIVRLMSQLHNGLAPINWQYGGALEPAPAVLVARSDGREFDIEDYGVLDDFLMEHIDSYPIKVTSKDFTSYAKCYFLKESNLQAEAFFPKDTKCRVKGLESKVILNGKIGICTGTYQKGRVGVKISDFEGEFAIKPKNLEAV